MMEITGNVDPPPDFIDFEITTGTKKIIRLSHIGEPLRYIADVSESDFITPSGTECSDLSSGEDSEREENAASSKNSVGKESSASSKSQASKTSSVKDKTKTLFKFDARNNDERRKKKKKHKKKDFPSRRGPGVQYSDSEFSSEEQDIKPKVRSIQSLGKPAKVEEPEEDKKPQLGAFRGFHCAVCNITANSELTLQTHLMGKRHRKELKAREIPDLAMQGVALMEGVTVVPPEPKLPKPIRRKLEHAISEIQAVADDHKNGPVPDYDEPGPSWRDDGIKKESADSALQGANVDHSEISSREDLNTSYSDYYCTVCDSHMNNKSVWESHVQGKRHLTNKRKPKNNIALKTKFFEDTNATAHLMRQLNKVHGPVVGLDYIKETQGELGEQYNCYLCGSCTSSYDITEHLLSSKHRIKFLDAVNKKGQVNGIAAIISMYNVPGYYKDSMIEDECFKHLQLYGSGRIKVYKIKEVLEQERRKY